MKGAIFSEDRLYRYALWRHWDERPKLMVIGLNPSTANEEVNDPTIKKVIKIADFNGFGGVYMLNLFGIVSKDPSILKSHHDPIAKQQEYLDYYSQLCSKIVFAWGNFKEARERSVEVEQAFPNSYALHINKNGSPKHPLYCKDNSQLIPFK